MAVIQAPRETNVDVLKAKVVACVRLLHMENILNYSGHVSARLPDGSGFIIQPYIESRATLRPEHLLTLDLELKNGPTVWGMWREPASP